jgi:hypothetical protein
MYHENGQKNANRQFPLLLFRRARELTRRSRSGEKSEMDHGLAVGSCLDHGFKNGLVRHNPLNRLRFPI